MKKLICLILSLSILLYGCSTTSNLPANPQAQQQQEKQETTDIILGAAVFMAVVITVVIIAVNIQVRKEKSAFEMAEAKFQRSVGKTKSDIYAMYGPPNSIVDDGQGQGGTILEYLSVQTYGGGREGVSTVTYRKMFYLNKDNMVVSVKEDKQ